MIEWMKDIYYEWYWNFISWQDFVFYPHEDLPQADEIAHAIFWQSINGFYN